MLRDAFPRAHLEILGYKHIVALAEKRFYADATRSIEYGPLASFFARGAELPNELSDYFGSFDLIVSYLFDPDGIFAHNLERSRVAQLLTGSGRLGAHEHAALQLARPLEHLGLVRPNAAAEIFPSAKDHAAAVKLLPRESRRLIAIHPGSGGARKNWPVENWGKLGLRVAETRNLVLLGGEADADALNYLKTKWRELPVTYVEHQSLTTVAAILARADHFIGHDSGISHIAAAVGARCTLLFGPTDPKVWAPRNRNVQVLRPTSERVADLATATVFEATTS